MTLGNVLADAGKAAHASGGNHGAASGGRASGNAGKSPRQRGDSAVDNSFFGTGTVASPPGAGHRGSAGPAMLTSAATGGPVGGGHATCIAGDQHMQGLGANGVTTAAGHSHHSAWMQQHSQRSPSRHQTSSMTAMTPSTGGLRRSASGRSGGGYGNGFRDRDGAGSPYSSAYGNLNDSDHNHLLRGVMDVAASPLPSVQNSMSSPSMMTAHPPQLQSAQLVPGGAPSWAAAAAAGAGSGTLAHPDPHSSAYGDGKMMAPRPQQWYQRAAGAHHHVGSATGSAASSVQSTPLQSPSKPLQHAYPYLNHSQQQQQHQSYYHGAKMLNFSAQRIDTSVALDGVSATDGSMAINSSSTHHDQGHMIDGEADITLQAIAAGDGSRPHNAPPGSHHPSSYGADSQRPIVMTPLMRDLDANGAVIYEKDEEDSVSENSRNRSNLSGSARTAVDAKGLPVAPARRQRHSEDAASHRQQFQSSPPRNRSGDFARPIATSAIGRVRAGSGLPQIMESVDLEVADAAAATVDNDLDDDGWITVPSRNPSRQGRKTPVTPSRNSNGAMSYYSTRISPQRMMSGGGRSSGALSPPMMPRQRHQGASPVSGSVAGVTAAIFTPPPMTSSSAAARGGAGVAPFTSPASQFADAQTPSMLRPGRMMPRVGAPGLATAGNGSSNEDAHGSVAPPSPALRSTAPVWEAGTSTAAIADAGHGDHAQYQHDNAASGVGVPVEGAYDGAPGSLPSSVAPSVMNTPARPVPQMHHSHYYVQQQQQYPQQYPQQSYEQQQPQQVFDQQGHQPQMMMQMMMPQQFIGAIPYNPNYQQQHQQQQQIYSGQVATAPMQQNQYQQSVPATMMQPQFTVQGMHLDPAAQQQAMLRLSPLPVFSTSPVPFYQPQQQQQMVNGPVAVYDASAASMPMSQPAPVFASQLQYAQQQPIQAPIPMQHPTMQHQSQPMMQAQPPLPQQAMPPSMPAPQQMAPPAPGVPAFQPQQQSQAQQFQQAQIAAAAAAAGMLPGMNGMPVNPMAYFTPQQLSSMHAQYQFAQQQIATTLQAMQKHAAAIAPPAPPPLPGSGPAASTTEGTEGNNAAGRSLSPEASTWQPNSGSNSAGAAGSSAARPPLPGNAHLQQHLHHNVASSPATTDPASAISSPGSNSGTSANAAASTVEPAHSSAAPLAASSIGGSRKGSGAVHRGSSPALPSDASASAAPAPGQRFPADAGGNNRKSSGADRKNSRGTRNSVDSRPGVSPDPSSPSTGGVSALRQGGIVKAHPPLQQLRAAAVSSAPAALEPANATGAASEASRSIGSPSSGWQEAIKQSNSARRAGNLVEARRILETASQDPKAAAQVSLWLDLFRIFEESSSTDYRGVIKPAMSRAWQAAMPDEVLGLRILKMADRNRDIDFIRGVTKSSMPAHIKGLQLAPVHGAANAVWRVLAEAANIEAKAARRPEDLMRALAILNGFAPGIVAAIESHGTASMAQVEATVLSAGSAIPAWAGPALLEVVSFADRWQSLQVALHACNIATKLMPRHGPLIFSQLRLLELCAHADVSSDLRGLVSVRSTASSAVESLLVRAAANDANAAPRRSQPLLEVLQWVVPSLGPQSDIHALISSLSCASAASSSEPMTITHIGSSHRSNLAAESEGSSGNILDVSAISKSSHDDSASADGDADVTIGSVTASDSINVTAASAASTAGRVLRQPDFRTLARNVEAIARAIPNMNRYIACAEDGEKIVSKESKTRLHIDAAHTYVRVHLTCTAVVQELLKYKLLVQILTATAPPSSSSSASSSSTDAVVPAPLVSLPPLSARIDEHITRIRSVDAPSFCNRSVHEFSNALKSCQPGQMWRTHLVKARAMLHFGLMSEVLAAHKTVEALVDQLLFPAPGSGSRASDPDVATVMLKALASSQEASQAKSLLDEALKTCNTAKPLVHVECGRLCEAVGDIAGAREHYTAGIECLTGPTSESPPPPSLPGSAAASTGAGAVAAASSPATPTANSGAAAGAAASGTGSGKNARSSRSAASDWRVWHAAALCELRAGNPTAAMELCVKSLQASSTTGRIWALAATIQTHCPDHLFPLAADVHLKSTSDDFSPFIPVASAIVAGRNDVEAITGPARTLVYAARVVKAAFALVPRSGEVWAEAGRLHSNPLSPFFDLAAASACFARAADFTQQYGDVFIEQQRVALLSAAIHAHEGGQDVASAIREASGGDILALSAPLAPSHHRGAASKVSASTSGGMPLEDIAHVRGEAIAASPNYGPCWVSCVTWAAYEDRERTIDIITRSRDQLVQLLCGPGEIQPYLDAAAASSVVGNSSLNSLSFGSGSGVNSSYLQPGRHGQAAASSHGNPRGAGANGSSNATSTSKSKHAHGGSPSRRLVPVAEPVTAPPLTADSTVVNPVRQSMAFPLVAALFSNPATHHDAVHDAAASVAPGVAGLSQVRGLDRLQVLYGGDSL